MLERFRIVVALDRTEYAELVLEHALDLAARHDASDLHVLTVLDRHDDVDAEKQRVAQLVREGLETFHPRPELRVRLHIVAGHAAEEISALAADVRADMLVVGRFGAHGRKSVSDRVLEASPCPTLVVKLTDQPVEAHEQCPYCVAVRDDSAGERWFCKTHADSDRVRLTTLLPPSGSLSHGGLLW
jgi:nucleotide-binding universal stress UspA family protein